MNQDKKTSSFLKAINKYALEQSNAIRLQVEEFRKQEIEKATEEGISDAYNLIQKEVATKKASIISDFSRREQDSRKNLFVKRNEIVESVIADAKAELIKYTKTDIYTESLVNNAKQIAALFENKACVVYVKPDDTDKKDIITAVLSDCTFLTDSSIEIGGIKAYCEQLSVLVDETLDTKLIAEREAFIAKSQLKVV